MSGARAVTDYWYRLRAMDPSEVAHRVLDQAMRWAEPASRRSLAQVRLPNRGSAFPQLPDRLNAPPSLRAAIRDAAKSIRSGRWVLFGWREVDMPDPPDWQRDYAHDPGRAAGSEPRNVWEINRWSELVRLAQNAWLNQEREDARLVQRWLNDWCARNPVGVGVNWRSGLEAGVRLVNFCWIDALIRGCGDAALRTAQLRLAQQIVPAHAWWVWRRRSFGSSANNHLIGELAGLVLAARRWPAVSRVCGSAERAWEMLSRELLRQFAADGGNREQALHYHLFAWELAWQAHRVMGRFHGAVAERLRAAGQFWCDHAHTSEPWDFGDSDDAQVTPFTAGIGSARNEWKTWLTGGASPALHFWLGRAPQIPALRAGSWRVYRESGLAVQDAGGWKARLDASPLGWGRLAAHGHLDALHVSLWDGARALVVDPGTGAYLGDRSVRDRLASWEWHNGPIPQFGLSRPRRRGAFVWSDHHDAPELSVDGATAVARRYDGGAPVTRCVRYASDAGAWTIEDRTPPGVPYVVRWRLAPAWRALPCKQGVVALAHAGGEQVRLTLAADQLQRCDVSEDVVAPHFGRLERAPVITVTFRDRLVSHWQRGGSPLPAPSVYEQ
ncbi:MAG TPA: heparinase II/III family protein [Gemmatimonadales bacterium]|nr:heparinase II/III family protein [Gemmatimonadales bacterium]